MRNWLQLLDKDIQRHPELKYYIDNISQFSEEDLSLLDIKKDIKKRLILLKNSVGEDEEIILNKKERIEKCISFQYTEDKKGKIYTWKNNLEIFDITGKNERYDILINQPFWISDDNKLIKMDTLTFISINPKILNELEYIKSGTMTEFSDICSKFRNDLFDSNGGEIIDLTNNSSESTLRYTIF